jgi:hypothetical protein
MDEMSDFGLGPLDVIEGGSMPANPATGMPRLGPKV